MNKRLLLFILPLSILLITIKTVVPYPNTQLNLLQYINNTYVWWGVQVIILVAFFNSKRKLIDKKEIKSMLPITLFLIWCVFSIVRGFFIAETYWEWKGLISNAMGLFLMIIAYIAVNASITQKILSYYIRYVLPLFFLFAFLIFRGAFAWYLIPISFFTFFLPILNFRWKIIIILFSLIAIFGDLTGRSNIIKFVIPLILLIVYYYRYFISNKFLELIRISLFTIPIILFILAVTGKFNVFNMDEYISGDYTTSTVNSEGEVIEGNLKNDTRSQLYVEVLKTADKYNSWWIGRSPARGNETQLFSSISEVIGKEERLGNEVGILNIFIWTGAIGVILYTVIFLWASFLAINRSNNIFCKIIGLYIAFRWLYSWVEDISDFNLNYFFIWIMIGFCISKSFRQMNNNEISLWARGIFSKRNKFRKNSYDTAFSHSYNKL